jgi:hypothetical protein
VKVDTNDDPADFAGGSTSTTTAMMLAKPAATDFAVSTSTNGPGNEEGMLWKRSRGKKIRVSEDLNR